MGRDVFGEWIDGQGPEQKQLSEEEQATGQGILPMSSHWSTKCNCYCADSHGTHVLVCFHTKEVIITHTNVCGEIKC